jgi:2-haloacid dehalogenase
MTAQPTTVIFDLGNVLIGWDPRNLYRKLFDGRDAEMEWFLANVCNGPWNLEQDRGRSFAQAVEALLPAHPERLHALIRAYDERWHEMLSGELQECVAVLRALHSAGTPLYALTNWNQDKFRHARELYPFLGLFDGIVVSGEEGLVKPELAIFHTLLERYALRADDCVFIDDSLPNVKSAAALGMHALHYQTADALAGQLRGLGFTVD